MWSSLITKSNGKKKGLGLIAMMPLRSATTASSLLLFAALIVGGCKSSDVQPAQSPCKSGVEGEIETGAKTGVSGAKTGVETGVEGVKAVGNSAVGLVEGGKKEAKARWKEGKEETKETARDGAAETKQQAHTPKCK